MKSGSLPFFCLLGLYGAVPGCTARTDSKHGLQVRRAWGWAKLEQAARPQEGMEPSCGLF